MDADLTFNTIVFAKNWDLKDESLRSSVARGVNTPDKLIIKSTEYTDSKTKVSGTRTMARVERYDIDANLAEINTSAQVVFALPKTATQAAIDNVIATFKAVVADANFAANIIAGQK